MSWESQKKRLAELTVQLCVERKALGEPPYLLRSGKTSRWYLDVRKLLLDSRGLPLVTRMIWQHVNANVSLGIHSEPTTFAGPGMGAAPLVGALLHHADNCTGFGSYRGLLLRPEAKSHGKESRLIGNLQKGDGCVLVEDVTTTGGSLLDCVQHVREAGGNVLSAYVVVDRSEPTGLEGKSTAALALEAAGVPFHPLLTAADLGISPD